MRAVAEYGHVGVFCGGDSREREISLQSGRAVSDALRGGGVHASLVDTADRGIDFAAYDRAFILLHGRGGEDGKIQAALEHMRVPYTGSGVAASSLSMNKWHTKAVWQSAGLRTPAYRVLRAGDDLTSIDASGLAFPLFVKPAPEGSSVGMTRVENRAELPAAVAAAREYDGCVLLEQSIAGGEYTYSYVAGLPRMPLIRIEPARGFYDYEAKYLRDDTKYIVDPELAPRMRDEYVNQAQTAFELLGLAGWGRVDFIVDADGRAWFIEANSVPGMTGHSLVPKAAAVVGVDFFTLCLGVLESSYGD